MSLLLALLEHLPRGRLPYIYLHVQMLSAQRAQPHLAGWSPLPGTLLPLLVPEYKPLNYLQSLDRVCCVIDVQIPETKMEGRADPTVGQLKL